MLDKQIKTLLTEQINHEFYSSYLYLEFENFFSCKGLDGFASWYNVQKKEELDHGMLFIKYLRDEEEKICLQTIEKPTLPEGEKDADFKGDSCMSILEMGLEHEKFVTSRINNIYSLAQEKQDFRTLKFLDWFIDEQREEEVNANTLITRMRLFGGTKDGLYLLDRELSERKYIKPSLEI